MTSRRLFACLGLVGALSVLSGPGAAASDTATSLPYRNPLRSVTGLSAGRIDQGVDYAGSGPVYALGDGTVLHLYNRGWPGGTFISYQLADGPAAGYVVYVAENVTPKVKKGQQVTANTVLGTLHNAYPNMEIGWSANAGTGYAMCHRGYVEGHSTVCGLNMNRLLVRLGAPAGSRQPGYVTGKMPPGFPSWRAR